MDISTIHRTTNLTDAQRIDWLRLIRSDNVRPRAIMAQTPQRAKSEGAGGLGRVNHHCQRSMPYDCR